MAILKAKEIKKMNEKDRMKKLKELKLELIKSKVGTGKGPNGNTKEIRKIIARIHTINKSEDVLNKK